MIVWPDTPVVRLTKNTEGRDYVVGDLHGSIDLLIDAMRAVRFRPALDRLLCVGDLIDRGNGSHRVAKMLAQPYVYSVLGNHESMLLEVYANGEPHPAVLEYLHSRNGFSWWQDADHATRQDILAAVRLLPLVIEVETDRGLMGLVHADVPKGMDWSEFTTAIRERDAAVGEVALWGRDRLHQNDDSGVPGVNRLFVGHTPIKGILKLDNVVAIDTGAVFGLLDPMEDGFLSMLDISTGTVEIKTTQPMVRPDIAVWSPRASSLKP